MWILFFIDGNNHLVSIRLEMFKIIDLKVFFMIISLRSSEISQKSLKSMLPVSSYSRILQRRNFGSIVLVLVFQ